MLQNSNRCWHTLSSQYSQHLIACLIDSICIGVRVISELVHLSVSTRHDKHYDVCNFTNIKYIVNVSLFHDSEDHSIVLVCSRQTKTPRLQVPFTFRLWQSLSQLIDERHRVSSFIETNKCHNFWWCAKSETLEDFLGHLIDVL